MSCHTEVRNARQHPDLSPLFGSDVLLCLQVAMSSSNGSSRSSAASNSRPSTSGTDQGVHRDAAIDRYTHDLNQWAAIFQTQGRNNLMHTAQSHLVQQPAVAPSRNRTSVSVIGGRPGRRQSKSAQVRLSRRQPPNNQGLQVDERAVLRRLAGHGSRSVVSYSECSKVCAANVMTAVFHPAVTMIRNSAILQHASRFITLNATVSYTMLNNRAPSGY